MPISTVVRRLQALKDDSSKVLVAAIGGDLPGDIASDDARERYSDWRCDILSPTKVTTHACVGPSGEAAVASRFIHLSEQMGRYGSFHNLCASGGLTNSLTTLATRVGTELMRSCLPSRVLWPDLLQPWIISSDGSSRALSTNEYDLIRDESCPPEGDYQAIRILSPLNAGDSVSISFDLTLADRR